MDLLSLQSGASATPPSAPGSPSHGWIVPGSPGVSPTSVPGPYWFYQQQAEWANLFAAAGITPNQASLTQIKQALDVLYALTLETTASDSSYASVSTTHAASPQWVKGLIAQKVLGSNYASISVTSGTWYTNSTGHPIDVVVVANLGIASSGWGNVYAQTTDVNFGEVIGISNDARSCGSFTMTVPPGKQWQVSWSGYVNSINVFTLS